MTTFKIDNYYLDTKKVGELECSEERSRIHSYYMDMLHCSAENRTEMARSLFHTLYNNGFLKDAEQESREEKLTQVLS
jgi:hypothetical protein